VGTPSEVYEFPKTRYIADFVGSINLFEGVVAESPDSEHVTVKSDDGGVEFHLDSFQQLAIGSNVAVAIRPEKIAISKEEPAQQENRCRGKVDEIAYQGSLSIYQIELPGGKMVRVTTPNLTRTAERPIDWDEEVWLCWARHAGVILAD
jgi:putrescine transport system ATP-binding protein